MDKTTTFKCHFQKFTVEPQTYIIYSTKQIIFRVGGYINKYFRFFSTFQKITIGGFVNQLIKNSVLFDKEPMIANICYIVLHK